MTTDRETDLGRASARLDEDSTSIHTGRSIERQHRSRGLRIQRACLVGVAVAAVYAAMVYQRHLDVPQPAVLQASAPVASRSHGPARRLVWILVDGLRWDASAHMPVLNRLGNDGRHMLARAEFPTYTVPNFVTQASGIEPDASGVMSNEYRREVQVDSVFRLAKMRGLRTCAVSTSAADRGLLVLYESWFDETRVEDPVAGAACGDLVLIHLGYPDEAAHSRGARSREYAAAVARSDESIARVARALDPGRDALVVTSDHGHLSQGGHGGVEAEVVKIPIVLWGAGITRAGTSIARPARDVGPTIAGLLGLGPLRHATGRSLLHETPAAAHQRAAVRRVLLGSPSSRRASCIPFVITAIASTLVLLALLGFGTRRGFKPRHVLGSLIYPAVLVGLLHITHTVSFSASNDSVRFAVRLALLCALAGVAQLVVGRRRSLALATVLTSLAVTGTVLLAAHPSGRLPDEILYFLPIPAFGSLGFVCAMLAALGTEALRAAGTVKAPVFRTEMRARTSPGRNSRPRRPRRVSADGIGDLKAVR